MTSTPPRRPRTAISQVSHGRGTCLVALLAAIPLLLCAAVVLPGSAPRAAEEEIMVDGVRHLRNAVPLTPTPERIELEELWRAGGADDEESFFGLIVDVVSDDQGRIYLLDAQLSEVVVFAPDGRREGTLFREGEGPGEVHGPRDLLALPDGSLGVVQEAPGKVIAVSRENIPQPSLIAERPDGSEGFVVLIAGVSGGGNIVLSGIATMRPDEAGRQERHNFLASFTREGSARTTYATARGDYDFSAFTFDERLHSPPIWWGFTVGPDGRVYAALDFDRYAISVFEPGGDLAMVIERDHEPLRRASADLAAMRRNIANALPPGAQVEIAVSETDPAIAYMHRGLRVPFGDRLWVLPSRGYQDQPPGVFATYDVFDLEGQWRKQVSLACEGDGNHDGLFLLGDGRAVLVRGYLEALAAMFGSGTPLSEEDAEAPPMEVICYRFPE
ncbi:MAG: hypothetical protein GF330_07755 [Candidatus Eisenbacteria bacterium]|nr:hypothetical protein [Candidatus Eisenbacteria bacterium]